MTLYRRISSSIVIVLLTLISIIFMFPIVLAIMNSFKTQGEMFKSVLSLPTKMNWENYVHVLTDINLINNLYNTFIITALSVIGIVFCGSLAGYKLSRTPGKLSNFIFFLFLASMLVPFYTIMFSLIQVAKFLHIQGSIYGIPLIYIGLGVNLAIFLYHGFVKSIPREIEESARIDGCSQLKTFTLVIFPLLVPITVTIVILNTLWIWNDFLLPLVMINKYNNYTLVLAASIFFGQYTTEYSSILCILILTSLPVVIIYLLFQKYIVEGIADGAVKG
jgi:raffinose/stachyose/melibiose transport system permease protein